MKKAYWSRKGKPTVEVAVKKLKPHVKHQEKIKFLQEAAIMGQFNHINVIKLHGVITDHQTLVRQWNIQ